MSKNKKVEIPEDLTALDEAALRALADEVTEEIGELNALGDEISDEQLEQLESLLGHIDSINGAIASNEEAAQARADRIAAARERAAAATTPAEDGDPEGDPEGGAEGGDPAAEVDLADAPAEEVVTASAGTRRRTVASASRRATPAPKPQEFSAPKERKISIKAAANVPEFTAGQALEGLADITTAFHAVTAGRPSNSAVKPGVYEMSPNAVRRGVARVTRDAAEHEVSRDMSLEDQFRMIVEASNEATRFKGTNLAEYALTAAGGWCAPSEISYELFGYETSAGMIDVPEVTARRGGIQFTKGPDFMAIFGDADAGWIMTEAQAEAGTFTKPCYALDCPPFEEVRLDAIGFCATMPFLTDAAYPELTRRVLQLLSLGHERRKSKYTIDKILSMITTTVNWTEIGGSVASGYADVLGGLELQAMRIRQSLAMDPNATIEGFAPMWLRAAFRHELSRRLSLTDPFNVSDADVDRHLALRGIRLQYVYDYQMLATGNTASWTAFPTSVEIPLYPAGAFTRLRHDVISLDAVYDHDLLTQNEYTAMFAEEGIAVANTRGYGLKLQVGLNYTGGAGFPGIGAGEGITFAATP